MKLVGKVKEAHGLRGEFYVLLFSGDSSWLPRLKSFGLGECPSPKEKPSDRAVRSTLTCQKVKPFKKGLIIKAVELGDRTAAEEIEGMGFYIPDDFLVSQAGEGIYLEEVRGFTVKDAEEVALGVIVDFSTNGAQDLLVVRPLKGRDFEIPFVDAFLMKIDFKGKIVKMSLPDGLMDLDPKAAADDGLDEDAD